MEEITSDDLRRRGSSILDRVLQGERLAVTRNGRMVGVLVPLPEYNHLTCVTVGELAHTLKVRPATVLKMVNSLIETEGRDKVVYTDLGGAGGAGLRLYATAGAQIYNALAQPDQPQSPQPQGRTV